MKSNKEIKINEVKIRIEELKDVLKNNGFTVKIGAEKDNQRNIYVYKNEVVKELKVYNSSKKSIKTTSYTYKIGSYFLSEIRQLNNEFSAIKRISNELV